MRRILHILLIIIPFVSAQENSRPTFFLSADSLDENERVYTGSHWKYNPGDNPDWIKPGFNDSTWETTASTLNVFELPQKEFKGKAWFRLHLVIDSSLVNNPLTFDMWLAGAAEIYINGEKKFTYGKISESGNTENYIPVFPDLVTFKQTHNVIAVRYFNDYYKEMMQKNFTPGFSLQFGYASKSYLQRYEYLSHTNSLAYVFTTLSLVLAIIHFFLFAFDRKQKQNLFYVMFLLFFAAFLNFNLTTNYGQDILTKFLFFRLAPAALIFTILFGSTTIYSIYRPLKSYFGYIVLVAFLLGLTAFFTSGIILWYLIYAFITGTSIWGSNVLYNPKYSRNTPSDWIVRIGFATMAVSGIYQMLLSLGVLDAIFNIYIPFVYGVVVFILSMSIALARDYATTSKNLEKKLIEVKKLSEKTLQQELEAKELDIQKRILEADNKLKTDELEAARSVQLAMLPQCLNDIEGLDICFEMHPATEVGGDYYDYKVADDGTLNVVIGDATGHGMKAGIMVATIKSLFSALGINMMIPDFFKKCTEIIKSMSLGNLFMSMTFIRIKDGRVFGSAAGMPPILIYRADKNEIEKIVIKSMPLGAAIDFPYNTFETEINAGDIILLMSDGFTELFNTKKEMLGEERIKKYFIESSNKSANNLVQDLLKKGAEWRKEHPQEDDVTFVAIKKK